MHRADRGIERLDLDVARRLNAAGQPDGELRVLIGDRGGNPTDLGVESARNSSRRASASPTVSVMTRSFAAGYGITYDPMPFGRPLRGFYPLTIAQQFVATAAGASETFTPWGFTPTCRAIAGLPGRHPGLYRPGSEHRCRPPAGHGADAQPV